MLNITLHCSPPPFPLDFFFPGSRRLPAGLHGGQAQQKFDFRRILYIFVRFADTFFSFTSYVVQVLYVLYVAVVLEPSWLFGLTCKQPFLCTVFCGCLMFERKITNQNYDGYDDGFIFFFSNLGLHRQRICLSTTSGLNNQI